MEVKKLTPNEILKIATERQVLVNEFAEYLGKRYGLKGIRYTPTWEADQKLVQYFNKFGNGRYFLNK